MYYAESHSPFTPEMSRGLKNAPDPILEEKNLHFKGVSSKRSIASNSVSK